MACLQTSRALRGLCTTLVAKGATSARGRQTFTLGLSSQVRGPSCGTIPQLPLSFAAHGPTFCDVSTVTPTDPELAGQTLRMMRKTHGLTLVELAVAVGVTSSHLSRVETGERVASEGLLLRIADHLATLPKTSP